MLAKWLWPITEFEKGRSTEAASVMHLRRDSAKKVHTLGKKINAERQTAGSTPPGYSFTRPFGECTTDDRRPVGQHYK